MGWHDGLRALRRLIDGAVLPDGKPIAEADLKQLRKVADEAERALEDRNATYWRKYAAFSNVLIALAQAGCLGPRA